jgi:hypothetical protein
MAIKHLTQDAVSVRIDAPPDRVYALVTDIARFGEWSPETTSARWLGGATAPAVGVRFRAWNRRGIARWTNRPTVTVADPGRTFAFSRRTIGAGEVVWRYDVEPDGDGEGTKLTESYDAVKRASPMVIWIMLRLMGIRDREGDLRAGMARTLERIKQAAEVSA